MATGSYDAGSLGGLHALDGLVRSDCTFHDEVVAGDHTLVILRLHAVRADASQPLVFHRSGSGSIHRGD